MKADDAAIRPRSVVPNQFNGLYAAFRGPVALDPRAGVRHPHWLTEVIRETCAAIRAAFNSGRK